MESSLPRSKRQLERRWEASEAKVFADMLADREALWNFNNIKYRSRELKQKCWQEIADATSHSVQDCKAFWNTTKSRYNAERHKVESSLNKDGVPTYKPRYILYEMLRFLDVIPIRASLGPPKFSSRTQSEQNLHKDSMQNSEKNELVINDESTMDFCDETVQSPMSIKSESPLIISSPISYAVNEDNYCDEQKPDHDRLAINSNDDFEKLKFLKKCEFRQHQFRLQEERLRLKYKYKEKQLLMKERIAKYRLDLKYKRANIIE